MCDCDSQINVLTFAEGLSGWVIKIAFSILRLKIIMATCHTFRQQAAATRERLKALNKKLDRIVVSTMTRAQETASIIKEGFPDTPTAYCSLLREGAPYPPEPKSSNWRPERVVCFNFTFVWIFNFKVKYYFGQKS